MKALDRITTDPKIMGGKPCIRGLRVTVANVLRLLAAGQSRERILQAYLETADIEACLQFAALAADYEGAGSRSDTGSIAGCGWTG